MGIEEELDEVSGAYDLRPALLQAFQRLDADGVGGVELGQIQPHWIRRRAYSEEVGNLRIREASGHTHNARSSLVGDVDPALHIDRGAQVQPTRHRVNRPGVPKAVECDGMR